MVISPLSYNSKVGLAVLCPITSQIKGYPFEVLVPPNLKVSGAILADQVKSLDWRARKIEFLCRVPRRTMAEVILKLGALISPADG